MTRRFLTVLIASLIPLLAAADGPATSPSYANNFEAAPVGKAPEKFLMLAGAFTVQDVAGNKVLELPGQPLEHMGALFGPADQAAVEVRAKVWAATTGRRFPEFGIGAADAFGYKLWLLPRTQRLVLRKGEDIVATAPCTWWQSDTWTAFSLRVAKDAAGGWVVEGTASPVGAENFHKTAVRFEEKSEPAAGRGSVWGTPFSDKPIRFDDVEVRVLK